jgi:hypothetical protein
MTREVALLWSFIELKQQNGRFKAAIRKLLII